MTAYHEALVLLKESFVGGGEGAFYLDALSAISAREIDWLEVGIGASAQSVMPFVRALDDAGCAVRLLGVDPDAQAGDVDFGHSRIRLVRGSFEDFPLTDSYAVVSMDQSLYYLSQPRRQVARAVSALKPGGLFIATCWSSADTMCRIHRALLAESSVDVTGEGVYEWLTTSNAVGNVHRQYFHSKVNLATWRTSRAHMEAALTIILRGIAPETRRSHLLERLAAILEKADAYAPRLNVALRARRADSAPADATTC